MAFLLLGIGYLDLNPNGEVRIGCIKAGGVFGLLAAFLAWYNAFAGMFVAIVILNIGLIMEQVSPTRATASLLYQSCTSRGLTRAVRSEERSTMPPHVPSSLSKRLRLEY